MNIPALLASVGPLGTPELLIILFIFVLTIILAIVPFWFICKKAGFSPWLSLLIIVPFGAIILPFLLAFMEWPALKTTHTNQV